MGIQGRRRSSNIEDRGAGTASRGSGIPIQALRSIVRMLGPKGTFAVAAIAAVGYFAVPEGLRQQLLGQLLGGKAAGAGKGQSKACEASPKNAQACDFSATILASTEDVWDAQFQRQALPNYGKAMGTYRHPTLVVFTNTVNTGGCGSATSEVGPFYCSGDQKLYIDPSFYDVMEQRLKAPGDFAQAYVIARKSGTTCKT